MVKEGEKFTHGLNTVLALESGDGEIRVCRVEDDTPWVLGRPYKVHARELVAEPRRHHGGEIPGDAKGKP